MKNKIIAVAGVGLLTFVLAQTVQAVPITGGITMGGALALNTTDVNTATTVTTWGNPTPVTANTVSGSFAAIVVGTPVSMTPNWVFSPAPGNPLSPLWSVGGFSFNFLTDTIMQGGGFLNVIGTGTISANGYDTTPFTWRFSTQDPGQAGQNGALSFTWSASTAGVPDGGATVMLLGMALSGVALLRKKLVA